MLNEQEKNYIITTYPVIMDFADIMSLLQVSERTVYRLISSGEMPGWKEEDEWNVLRSDVIAYLEKEQH